MILKSTFLKMPLTLIATLLTLMREPRPIPDYFISPWKRELWLLDDHYREVIENEIFTLGTHYTIERSGIIELISDEGGPGIVWKFLEVSGFQFDTDRNSPHDAEDTLGAAANMFYVEICSWDGESAFPVVLYESEIEGLKSLIYP
jgi:hypothetical protein